MQVKSVREIISKIWGCIKIEGWREYLKNRKWQGQMVIMISRKNLKYELKPKNSRVSEANDHILKFNLLPWQDCRVKKVEKAIFIRINNYQ